MDDKKMKTVCTINFCTGCMACFGKCKKNAITIKDGLAAYNAVIDEAKCVSCGACERVCPNNQKVELHEPISWQEGWAAEDIRMNSSSGGAASAMMKHFVEEGGYVAACLFKNGEFVFDITNKIEDIVNFVGSKYVKSNPIGIYTKVAEKLKVDSKVLFVGLPCQVAALKNFTAMLPAEKKQILYTIDLICHGTPSPQILNLALREKGIDIKSLTSIRFRNKTNFGLSSHDKIQEYKTITPSGVQDMYTYAFLTSLDYTENCYFCRYATLSRTSDVTIGDSWGSDLPSYEQRKGVSLLICQNNKGINLVQNSGMQLKDVDVERAIEANHQLRHPSIAPEGRKIFFANMNKGFNKAISKCAPKVYYKQKLKETLVKLKIVRGGASPIEYKISIK
nr:Coenzyme F420 hydrogenase/dehydrogenase, beta subunit C-terminal domain [uncultured Blautia sp.]